MLKSRLKMPHSLSKFNKTHYGDLFHWDGLNTPPYWSPMLEKVAAKASAIALMQGEARGALKKFEQGRPRSHVELLRTIAAGIALHASGGSANLENGTPDFKLPQTWPSALEARFDELWKSDSGEHHPIASELGLSMSEQLAVTAYTNPKKNERVLSDEPEIGPPGERIPNPHYNVPNPHYMFQAYGGFSSGWDALQSALNKIPSFATLGLRAPTFRAVRNTTELQLLNSLFPGDRVVMGATRMRSGQYHVTSTSLTYSSHLHAGKIKNAGGLLAFSGTSGVFINWLGTMTMSTDGGEVVYRPGTIMQLVEKVDCGYADNWPVYILSEPDGFNASDMKHYRFFDDLHYSKICDPSVIISVRAANAMTDTFGLFS